jgi:glycosyltransferase involved in cell wall biosynthesis
MHYNTALRAYGAKRIEEIETADILIGIPCFNNEKTIERVIQMITHGLSKHYKEMRSVLFIADGGSTDDTREVAREFQLKPWQEKIVTIYRGPGGKGTALRSVFEAANRLKIKACAVVDSDLRSITPDWVKYLLDPVLDNGYQFVAPVYVRHKYDGTITNNIVYNLTRALYGKRIRQPIGGDFAISRDVVSFYVDKDVWETDIARFGIDAWMTTSVVAHNFRMCQSNLGVKIHDAKDPSQHLAPMFRQVMWTVFALMEEYEGYWKNVKGSEALETFGYEGTLEPEAVNINLDGMIENFKVGFQQLSALWHDIFSTESFQYIKEASEQDSSNFHLPTDAWVQILYELAATFHSWKINRHKLIDLMTPLYYARVASFVRQTWDMSSKEAEVLVEEQAVKFEEHKDYLIRMWDEKDAIGPGTTA